MLLTDYFRSKKDLTWDLALQCGVTHGVIRLPEDDGFDILIAYGMLPKLRVENPNVQSAVANGKTRYNGKMLYTS